MKIRINSTDNWLARKKIIELYVKKLLLLLLYGVWAMIYMPYSIYRIIKNELLLNIIELYDNVFLTTRNGVFFGSIFVLLGFYATEINNKKNRNIVCFIISYIVLLIEIYALRYYGIARGYDMTLFLIPATFYFFNIVKQINIKDKKIYFYLRKFSAYIYFAHLWIMFILDIMKYKVLHININSLINCLLILLILVLSYIGIMRVKNKRIRIIMDKIL